MIFTLDQINAIWHDKTAVVDKIYLCDDMYRYKGVLGGYLTRILTGNLDDYKAELRRQQLAFEQEEYNESITIDSLVESVTLLQSNSNSKQTVITFGELQFQEAIYITIPDTDTLSNSIIQCSISIANDRDIDELEFTNFICSPYDVKQNIGYKVLITDSNRQATGKYLLNTTRH